jgi:serine/threonine protein kinase
LTGIQPFQGKNLNDIITKNKEANIIFNNKQWNEISEEGQDLCKKMLAKKPEERISAKDALSHAWFSLKHSDSLILPSAQENMRKYNEGINKQMNNMKDIKLEELSRIITASPLLIGRSRGQKDSPFDPTKIKHFVPSPFTSPMNAPDQKVIRIVNLFTLFSCCRKRTIHWLLET